MSIHSSALESANLLSDIYYSHKDCDFGYALRGRFAIASLTSALCGVVRLALSILCYPFDKDYSAKNNQKALIHFAATSISFKGLFDPDEAMQQVALAQPSLLAKEILLSSTNNSESSVKLEKFNNLTANQKLEFFKSLTEKLQHSQITIRLLKELVKIQKRSQDHRWNRPIDVCIKKLETKESHIDFYKGKVRLIDRKGTGIVGILPLELFERTLSYLDEMSLQQACLVSHLWDKTSLLAVIQRESSAIKKFVKFLKKNLNKEIYKIQLAELSNIENDDGISNSRSLIQIKSSICILKKRVIDILKIFEEKNLTILEELSKNKIRSIFLKNIFGFAKIYKKLDKAHQTYDTSFEEQALFDIAKIAAKSGNFDKAIEIAKKEPALQVSTKTKTTERLLDKATNIVNSLLANENSLKATLCIGDFLATSPNFYKIKNIADAITDDKKKNEFLAYISLIAAKSGNFLQALNIACFITDVDSKIYFISEVARIVTESGSFSSAIEIAEAIATDIDSKSHFISEIARRVVLCDNFDKVLEIADVDSRNYFIPEIAGRLAGSGDFDKALKIANNKPYILAIIAEKAVEADNFDKAVEIANFIITSVEKLSFLLKIVEKITTSKAFVKAVKFANSIINAYEKRSVLLKIVEKIATSGNFDIVVEIADFITDSENFYFSSKNSFFQKLLKQQLRAVILIKL